VCVVRGMLRYLVPMMVTVPPSRAEKDRGMSSLDSGMPLHRAHCKEGAGARSSGPGESVARVAEGGAGRGGKMYPWCEVVCGLGRHRLS
jgi:hypothetical protein